MGSTTVWGTKSMTLVMDTDTHMNFADKDTVERVSRTHGHPESGFVTRSDPPQSRLRSFGNTGEGMLPFPVANQRLSSLTA